MAIIIVLLQITNSCGQFSGKKRKFKLQLPDIARGYHKKKKGTLILKTIHHFIGKYNLYINISFWNIINISLYIVFFLLKFQQNAFFQTLISVCSESLTGKVFGE